MNNQQTRGVRKKKLLLLDTGDNCRCPMAEGYLRKLLHERGIDWIEISTAGVMTPTGLLPTPEAEQLLREEGVDISRHRSRPMKVHMLEEADLVLGMSSLHVQKAIREYKEIHDDEGAREKTFLLKEYVGYQGKDVQIPDPMGGTMDTFKRVFEQLKAALEKLVETDFIRIPPEEWTSQPAEPTTEDIEPETQEPPEEVSETEQRKPAKNITQEESLEVEAAPKRRRGRPPKSPQPKTETFTATPRKRGRPRKTVTAEQAAPATPRKRGRPRKSAQNEPEKARRSRRAATTAKQTKSIREEAAKKRRAVSEMSTAASLKRAEKTKTTSTKSPSQSQKRTRKSSAKRPRTKRS
ncbi:MAG: hypothetical protein ACP5UB_05945 [Candidatus Sumerlaeaceae bacterium]